MFIWLANLSQFDYWEETLHQSQYDAAMLRKTWNFRSIVDSCVLESCGCVEENDSWNWFRVKISNDKQSSGAYFKVVDWPTSKTNQNWRCRPSILVGFWGRSIPTVDPRSGSSWVLHDLQFTEFRYIEWHLRVSTGFECSLHNFYFGSTALLALYADSSPPVIGSSMGINSRLQESKLIKKRRAILDQ